MQHFCHTFLAVLDGPAVTQPAHPADLLTENQIRAIGELARGNTIAGVAETLGVDRAIFHRWLRDPAFEAERNLVVEEMREQVRSEALALAAEALTVVEEVKVIRDLLAEAKRLLKEYSMLPAASTAMRFACVPPGWSLRPASPAYSARRAALVPE